MPKSIDIVMQKCIIDDMESIEATQTKGNETMTKPNNPYLENRRQIIPDDLECATLDEFYDIEHERSTISRLIDLLKLQQRPVDEDTDINERYHQEQLVLEIAELLDEEKRLFDAVVQLTPKFVYPDENS